MAVSRQTLTQIQSLARLYQTGYRSNTVDATIEKLVDMERSRLQAELDSLTVHLRAFEQQYHLSSEEFHRQFEAGKMGDDADMFEWDAFYLMWLSTRQKLEALQTEQT
ncbi:MAG: hypothetical protein GWP10_15185 [Nitrospiraceae bacterium]|nr:hypothetical protein [Nitrospiraceae bacterium]